MTLRIAGLAALALLSSACTYRLQSPPREATPLDYSDHAFYDKPFAADPERPTFATTDTAAEASEGSFDHQKPSPRPTTDGALGFTAAETPRPTATVEASSPELEEVEATPGTACYQAALEAGITRGTCTLVVERKYLLVGETAN